MEDIGRLNLDYYEQVIVYKSLTNESYLTQIIDHIKPDYFNDKNIKTVFSLITNFYIKRQSIPTITELKSYLINDELKESFRSVVKNFPNIDKNFNDEELTSNTERFLKERAIYNTMLSVAEDVSKGEVNTSFILDSFEKSCNVNLKEEIGLDLFENIDKVVDDLNVDQPTISSGWKWLDDKIDGGFLENGRSLYVFAGESNVGKSIFLGNIACNIAAKGKTVLVISLEMSEMIYARRLSSNITRIPMRELKGAGQSLSAQIKSYNNGKPNSKILIKEFPPSTVTPQNIQGYITELKNRGIKVDAVVLDYLNLLKSPLGDNSYERVKHVAEGIRALSYVFECPFISATQLNRSGYDEENPGLDTISESIGMAATADCIFSIFQDDEDKELGIVKMGMMKNRYGANYGYTALRLNYDTLTISEDETLNVDDEGSEMSDLTNTLGLLSN
jgi:replicative DNA helicase